MKKIFILIPLIILTLLVTSCRPDDNDVSEDLVATQVSIILTETAIHIEEAPEPTPTYTIEPSPTEPEEPTPTATDTPTPTETATSTPDQEDPAQRLGAPAWTYEFLGDTSPWDFESTQALYQTSDGYLNITARANANWHNWWVSSPVLQNAYVESTIQMSECSGADRFGLIVRSTTGGQNFYFLSITCDGRWGFFRMAEDVEIETIIGYESTEAITPGLAQPHRVGIWMDGNTFNIYINGDQVGTATDSQLDEAGMTGFMIVFANTPGFTVQVDQLKYWNIP